MFRTSNPAFARQPEFQPAQSWDDLQSQGRVDSLPGTSTTAASGGKHMTVQGTVNKSFFLLALCVGTALLGWNITMSPDPIISPGLMMIGSLIGGLVVAMICCFAPKTSPVTAPLYALIEGFFVGGISAVYAVRFAKEGGALNTEMVFNAALLTFGILGGLLTGYSVGLIRPGPWFRNAVIAGTVGVCLYGAVAMVAALFGSFSLASVYDPTNGGLISIGFSLLVVGLASANLVLDFESIEMGARHRAPRYMEWYGAFGLLVTLVWLYLEILRLLGKLRSSD